MDGDAFGAFVRGGWPVFASRFDISCIEKLLLLLVVVSHRRGLRLVSPWNLAYGMSALMMLSLGFLWLLLESSGGGYDCREVWDLGMHGISWMARKEWCGGGDGASSNGGALDLLCRAGSL